MDVLRMYGNMMAKEIPPTAISILRIFLLSVSSFLARIPKKLLQKTALFCDVLLFSFHVMETVWVVFGFFCSHLGATREKEEKRYTTT